MFFPGKIREGVGEREREPGREPERTKERQRELESKPERARANQSQREPERDPERELKHKTFCEAKKMAYLRYEPTPHFIPLWTSVFFLHQAEFI